MTPLIANLLWVLAVIIIILILVDIFTTAIALKVVRHVEVICEVDHASKPQ